MPASTSEVHFQTNVAIGQLIRRARKARGLTQQALAGAIGVRFQQIQKYECAANAVSAVRLARIAVALNLPIQNLIPQELQVWPATDGVGVGMATKSLRHASEEIERAKRYLGEPE